MAKENENPAEETGKARGKRAGLVTKIAAVTGSLAVIAGLLTQVGSLIDAVETTFPKIAGYFAGKKAPCHLIRHFNPEVIPASLIHSIGDKDFPYWFRIDVDNSCERNLKLKVHFKSRRGPVAIPPPGEEAPPAIYDVPKGEHSFQQNVHPVIGWTNDRYQGELEINWFVVDDKDTKLDEGMFRIDLRPREEFLWDLKTPTGEQVSPEFLLASLAAWIGPDTSIEKLSKECGVQGGSFDSWMENCYGRLFAVGQAEGLRMRPQAQSFPKKENIVRLPHTLIGPSGAVANQLETALLVAALARGARRRLGGEVSLALLAMPDQGDPALKNFLFAWRARQNPWQAVSMGATGSSFRENLDEASRSVNTLWQQNPQVGEELAGEKGDGVYLAEDGQSFAIDFLRAKKCFGIGWMPQGRQEM